MSVKLKDKDVKGVAGGFAIFGSKKGKNKNLKDKFKKISASEDSLMAKTNELEESMKGRKW